MHDSKGAAAGRAERMHFVLLHRGGPARRRRRRTRPTRFRAAASARRQRCAAASCAYSQSCRKTKLHMASSLSFEHRLKRLHQVAPQGGFASPAAQLPRCQRLLGSCFSRRTRRRANSSKGSRNQHACMGVREDHGRAAGSRHGRCHHPGSRPSHPHGRDDHPRALSKLLQAPNGTRGTHTRA